MTPVRTLAAVLFTDMEGYTALMHRDEALALQWRERHRTVMVETHEQYGGEIIQYFGDGTLSIFPGAKAAVRCAVEIQRRLGGEPRVPLRIGIHYGEILRTADDIIGDAVNIASRIESFSVPGAVLVSQVVVDQTRHPSDLSFESLGNFLLKNITQPMAIYAVNADHLVVPDTVVLAGKGKRATPLIRRLPVHLTSFIGRERELAELTELLRENRLVTVTGPGGTGKTQLSVRVAKAVAKDFSDGVFWVELAPVGRPEQVAFAIARALGLGQDAQREVDESLVHFLEEKELLLVLDNFEQIVEAAPLVEQLLHRCPQLKMLVTSRIALRIAGEWEYAVPPLPLPKEKDFSSLGALRSNSAVALFCDRARAINRRFELAEDNAAAVAEICVRLDGLPLGIELAAARVKLLSPRALLAQLAKSLHILRSTGVGRPTRQQTLHQTVVWSYDLLKPEEQKLFQRLSVFTGGCTLRAAEEIAVFNGLSDVYVLDAVSELANHSLLQSEPSEEEPRFFMLETIRAVAKSFLESSPDSESVQGAHAAYFLQTAEAVQSRLRGAEQPRLLAMLEKETHNFRAALHWFVNRKEAEKAYRLAGALWRMWVNRGMLREGLQQIERVLELPLPDDQTALRLQLISGLAVLYNNTTEYQKALPFAEECLGLARTIGDEREIAVYLNLLGWIKGKLGDLREGIAYSKEALSIHEKNDDDLGRALAFSNLGNIHNYQGDFEESVSFLRQSLFFRQKIGDERGIGFAKSFLAFFLIFTGAYQEAETLIREAISVHEKNEETVVLTWAWIVFCFLRFNQGRLTECVPLIEQTEQLAQRVDARFALAWTNQLRGLLAREAGQFHEAERFFRLGIQIWEQVEPGGAIIGSAMLMENQLAMKNVAEALSLFQEAAGFLHHSELGVHLSEILEIGAAALSALEKNALAATCLAFAEKRRAETATPHFLMARSRIDELKEKLRRELGEEAFAAAWREGTAMTREALLSLVIRASLG